MIELWPQEWDPNKGAGGAYMGAVKVRYKITCYDPPENKLDRKAWIPAGCIAVLLGFGEKDFWICLSGVKLESTYASLSLWGGAEPGVKPRSPVSYEDKRYLEDVKEGDSFELEVPSGKINLKILQFVWGDSDWPYLEKVRVEYKMTSPTPTPEKPDPEIYDIYPSWCVKKDEYSTISVTVKNNGGKSSEGYISVSFPNNEQISGVRGTGNSYNKQYPKGSEIWDKDGKIPSSEHPLVELLETNWEKGQVKTIEMNVKPNSGSKEIVFYVRAALKSADGTYVRDPTYSDYTDQQGWYVERHTIDICALCEVVIDDDTCKGYEVYVANDYQFTEGEGGDDPLDGKCSFYVTGRTHTVEIRDKECEVCKTAIRRNFKGETTYRWDYMPDNWCKCNAEVKFRGTIVTDSSTTTFYNYKVKIDKILEDHLGVLNPEDEIWVWAPTDAQVDALNNDDKVEVYGTYDGERLMVVKLKTAEHYIMSISHPLDILEYINTYDEMIIKLLEIHGLGDKPKLCTLDFDKWSGDLRSAAEALISSLCGDDAKRMEAIADSTNDVVFDIAQESTVCFGISDHIFGTTPTLLRDLYEFQKSEDIINYLKHFNYLYHDDYVPGCEPPIEKTLDPDINHYRDFLFYFKELIVNADKIQEVRNRDDYKEAKYECAQYFAHHILLPFTDGMIKTKTSAEEEAYLKNVYEFIKLFNESKSFQDENGVVVLPGGFTLPD